MGIEQLEVTGEELLARGIGALIAKNQLLLRQNHIQISTLAWPETIALPYQESVIEMGAEIPYESQNKRHPGVSWRFAGIRLKITLHPQGDRIKVHYSTEVKRPGEQGAISGGLNQSVTSLRLGEVQKIFQIGLQTTADHKKALPPFHQIPLLGKIFTSSHHGNNFKKIIGHLKVEPAP